MAHQFRTIIAFHVAIAVLLTASRASSSEQDAVHENRCQLSAFFQDPSFKCWTTTVETQNSLTLVGTGSVCKRADSRDHIFKCFRGQWTKVSVSPNAVLKRKRSFLSVRLPSLTDITCHVFGGCGGGHVVRNSPPQIHGCPGNQNVSPAAGQTSARATWTVPTASDSDGPTPQVVRERGPESGSLFSGGQTSVIYKATDSKGENARCQFTVTVSVTYCHQSDSLTSLANGEVQCSGQASNVYGSVCTFSCHTGYQMVGPSQVTCSSDGHWTHAFPSCQPVSCGTPDGVDGAQVVCSQGHVFPQSCLIQCDSGFQHTGVTSIRCTNNGSWTASAPCTDVEPPIFPNGCPSIRLFSGPLESPIPVTWTDPVVNDNGGQNVTLASDTVKGSLMGPGAHVVQINATDVAGNHAACSLIVTVEARECIELQPPTNGHRNCTRRNVEGSTCTLTCDSGYQVQGQRSMTCLTTEHWDTNVSTCEGVTCPLPSTPHGQFSCAQGHQHPADCALVCDFGFAAQQPLTIRCLENATWSPLGRCYDVEPPDFVNGCPPDVHMYAAKIGEATHAQWTIPQVIDNSGEVITPRTDVSPDHVFEVGSTIVRYSASDSSGNNQSCQFAVNVTTVQCQSPDTDPSLTTRAMELTCPDGHVYGAVCTLNCTHGYRLQGRTRITCEQDNSTQPPTLFWQWAGSEAVKPQCKEDLCPDLQPPEHGALSCLLGDNGWDCFMSCATNWNMRRGSASGRVFCYNSHPVWTPPSVPDCNVDSLRSSRVRPNSPVFHFNGSCEDSVETLRQQFIQRLDQVFYGSCSRLASCVTDNVQVRCGPVPPQLSRHGREVGRGRVQRRSEQGSPLRRQPGFGHSACP